MKIFKKILVVIGGFFGILIFVLATIIAIIFYKPQVVWLVAEKYFLPEDLKISWSTLHFDAQMISLRHWQWAWQVDNLSIEKKSPEVQMIAKRTQVQINVNLFSQDPLLELSELVVQANEGGYVKLASAPAAPTDSEQNLFQQLKKYFAYAQTLQKKIAVRHVDIKIPKFRVYSGEASPWVINVDMSKSQQESSDRLHLEADVSGDDLVAHLQAEADFTLASPVVEAKLALNQGKNLALSTTIKGTQVDEQFKINGQGQTSFLLRGAKKPLLFSPTYELVIDSSAADLAVKTSIRNIPGVFVMLDEVAAKVHLPLSENEAWSEAPLDFNISSRIDFFLIDKDMRKPLEKSCKCSLPEEFLTTLSGQVWLSALFKAPTEKQKAVEAHLLVESVKNKLFDLNVAAHLIALRDLQQWYFEPVTDINLTVNSFQGLRQFLDAKQIIIPAPLDVLDGKITFVARDKVGLEDNQYKTLASLKIDLASRAQKVLIDTEVRLNMAETFKKLDVFIDVLIRKLRLELPPIDPVLGVPSFAKDQRILARPVVASNPGGLKVNVFANTRTEQAGGVELLSKYAKPFVPISIKVSSTSTASRGDVELEPFKISYLRRDIFVEKINISLPKAEQTDFPLKGRVRMEQGGYKIFIDLSGVIGSPTLLFSSDPYLPRSDIISVILFGRINDQLVSGDAETAGRFDAAVTDRAIGLVGLWAFATTPIQSFSYNAVTKVYTATVKLGDGLTAGVGTNWEKATNVEVRKRLSQRWALTASWAPVDTDQSRQQGRLVLQWEKRF